MRQPIRKGKLINKSKPKVKKRLRRPDGKLESVHPKFGTSKLEQDFAEQFLDTLGVDYIWQFEAKDIGRFYDFYLPKHNLIIEIDGTYYHSDPRVVDENKLNPMQKHNKRVDEHKNKWALMHGIPLIRIWEKDIREKPNKVLEALKKILYVADNRAILAEKKNKRHINKIK
jgi:very-short-patch-repair endonuclease